MNLFNFLELIGNEREISRIKNSIRNLFNYGFMLNIKFIPVPSSIISPDEKLTGWQNFMEGNPIDSNGQVIRRARLKKL